MRDDKGTALILVMVLLAIITVIMVTSAVTLRQLNSYLGLVEKRQEARLISPKMGRSE